VVCGIATPDSPGPSRCPSRQWQYESPGQEEDLRSTDQYRVPGRAELPERLDSVLTAGRLPFSTGRSAGEGDALVRETSATLDHDDWPHLQPLPLV